MKTKCKQCGLELLEGEKICPQCGCTEKRKPSSFINGSFGYFDVNNIVNFLF